MGNGKIEEIKRHLQTALSLIESLESSELDTPETLSRDSAGPSTTDNGPTFKQQKYLEGQVKKGNLKEIPPNLTRKQAWELVGKLKRGEKV